MDKVNSVVVSIIIVAIVALVVSPAGAPVVIDAAKGFSKLVSCSFGNCNSN